MHRMFHSSSRVLAAGAALVGLTACANFDAGSAEDADGGADASADTDGGSDDSRSSGGSSDDGDDSDAGGSGSGGGDGGSSTGSTSNTGGTVNFVPMFPGAPSSEAGKPLQGGMICDEVPGATVEAVTDITRCFYGETQSEPSATIEQVLECVDGVQTIHLRLTFNPDFNDNTFGAGSIGWPVRRGHRFRDLTGSDHAELKLVDGDGEVALQFKLDYIDEDASAPSGYASLCATGGDGDVSVGDASAIIDCTTSLDENLNARGYGDYTVDSPLTDESYSVNADAPEWDYRMVFEVWIDVAAFGDAGFSGAFIEYVHASPSKAPDDTIDVVSKECPPCVPGPDYVCDDEDPPTREECVDLPDDVCNEMYPPTEEECKVHPDAYCTELYGPPTEEECRTLPDQYCTELYGPPDPVEPPAFCELYPTDPACLIY